MSENMEALAESIAEPVLPDSKYSYDPPRTDRERFWQANDALLRQLWPTHSGTEIAGIIGAPSRCSVIARARRLGLENKAKVGEDRRQRILTAPKPPRTPPKRIGGAVMQQIKAALRAKEKALQNVCPPRFIAEPLPVEEPPPATRCSIWELSADMCRFPYGDSPFVFCGAHASGSWCSYHRTKVFERRT